MKGVILVAWIISLSDIWIATLRRDALIPFVVTASMFESIPDEYYESLYNRIIVPIDDSSRVYFFNTQSLELYSARLSGASYTALQTLANNSKKSSCPAAMYDVGSTFTTCLISQLTCLIRTIWLNAYQTLFIDLLFDDTSDVDMRYNNVTWYHDAVSELIIDNNSQELKEEAKAPRGWFQLFWISTGSLWKISRGRKLDPGTSLRVHRWR